MPMRFRLVFTERLGVTVLGETLRQPALTRTRSSKNADGRRLR